MPLDRVTELLGGVSVKMTRNRWESQVHRRSVVSVRPASHRLSLSKPRCKLVVSEMPTYRSQGPSSVRRYDYIHILTVAVLNRFTQGHRRTWRAILT